MPQLDIYSYSSQIVMIFFGFYIFLFCCYFLLLFWNFRVEVLRKDFFFFKVMLHKLLNSGLITNNFAGTLYQLYQSVYFFDFFKNIKLK